ncbi:MAG TPA: copper resistance CopC family protein [Bryobacteraceae bacterium]|jgi:hypothetical protein|nr:copper resistance CopC family protein [Bryobacteraceae bacterium]
MKAFFTLHLSHYVLFIATFFVFAITCLAHAILLDSRPAANQLLHSGNLEIALHFNSRVDGARSQLTLISIDGEKRIPLDGQKDSDKLLARASDLKPGTYRLVWQVLAADGHLTRGQIPFKVQ